MRDDINRFEQNVVKSLRGQGTVGDVKFDTKTPGNDSMFGKDPIFKQKRF